MKALLLEEAGYKSAIRGLALNKRQPVENMPRVALRLAPKGEPHCKFMRQMHVWFEITAKWKWWKQMATYRVGIETQSDSTMNNIMDRPLNASDFGSPLPNTILVLLNDAIHLKWFDKVTDWLPGNYLYTRVLDFSYSALKEIIRQRKNHKLPEWKEFIQQVLDQVEYPELLT